jgi:hypothetical protein
MNEFTVYIEGNAIDLYAEYLTYSEEGRSVLSRNDGEIVALVPPNALLVNWSSQPKPPEHN